MVKFMHQEHTKYNKKKRKVKEIIKLVFFSLLHSNVVYIYIYSLFNKLEFKYYFIANKSWVEKKKRESLAFRDINIQLNS